MTDDHATQAMSCYGNVLNKTPNMDRIAAEGMRFTNAFCVNSICAPSRASYSYWKKESPKRRDE